MEGDLDLPTKVAQAVHVLNHDSLSCNRVAANQWLVQFQQSPQAWSVATSILTSDLPPSPAHLEAEFFAAQILKRKIQTEASSLQLPAKEALLNALILAAKRFSIGPPQLLTQICLALSALILRAVEYKKPIEQLFSSLHNLQSQENGCAAVLEMLTVLPEEVIEDHNSDRSIDSTKRFHFVQELLSQTPSVLSFLLVQSESPQNGIQLYERNRKVLRCLLSWVRAGCFSEIPASSLPAHPLLNFVFNALQVSSSFDMAIEVLTELVSRYEGVPQVLLSRVHYLKEVLLLPAIASRDEKVIGGLACLLSEVGQAAPVLIAEAGEEALVLIQLLLSCVAFPADDWEIADSTLQFWCCLASYLLGLDADHANNKRKFVDIFAPIFSSLMDALLSRAEVEEHYLNDESGNFDIPDGLVHFRMNMEELLIDICQLMGSVTFVQKLFSGGLSASDLQIPWIQVETRMFVLNVVAESVLQEGPFDFSVVVRLIEILPTIASERLKGLMTLVYKSVADVVASYSKVILSAEDVLRKILLFCACGITESISSNACSLTLRKLCEDSSMLINNPSDFEILVWIGEGLEKKYHSLEEEEEIVGAITLVLGSIPNKELKNNMLSRLISPSYEAVGKLTVADDDPFLRQKSAAYMHTMNQAIRGLHRMGAIFSHLIVGHAPVPVEVDALQVLLSAVWPLLEKLFKSSHIESSNLSSAACRCLSLAVISTGDLFLALLPRVLDCLSTNFLMFQGHDCYIKTATAVIQEFGHREEFGKLCINTFERFTSAASITALNSSYVCDQEPDLVEAYTNFASTYVRCCHKDVLIASGSLLESSFEKAAICCTAMHRGAALSAMSYISCFLDLALCSLLDTVAPITEASLSSVTIPLLSRQGDGLFSNIIYALLGVSAMSRVQKSATILQQLAAICRLSEQTEWNAVLSWAYLRGWLHYTMITLPEEYLKPGEVGSLYPLWLDTLSEAALDILESKRGDSSGENRGHMQGKGGRALKRIIRDFAEAHRCSPGPAC